MAIVKINAIEVAEGAGPELERRFAARLAAVEDAPGFQGFELLRPVAGQNCYFVYTRWDSEEAFEAWASGPARQAHANGHGQPVASGATMLEFEVVQRAEPRVPA
jgi:heme oxygenase (mycobilin-producing)